MWAWVCVYVCGWCDKFQFDWTFRIIESKWKILKETRIEFDQWTFSCVKYKWYLLLWTVFSLSLCLARSRFLLPRILLSILSFIHSFLWFISRSPVRRKLSQLSVYLSQILERKRRSFANGIPMFVRSIIQFTSFCWFTYLGNRHNVYLSVWIRWCSFCIFFITTMHASHIYILIRFVVRAKTKTSIEYCTHIPCIFDIWHRRIFLLAALPGAQINFVRFTDEAYWKW